MKAAEIQSYRFGRMIVDGEVHTNDLILLPEQVVGNWWRREGHLLETGDLKAVFDARPKMLMVGTGAYGMMKAPNETLRAFEDAGIQIKVEQTGEAWRLYNNLREKQRDSRGVPFNLLRSEIHKVFKSYKFNQDLKN